MRMESSSWSGRPCGMHIFTPPWSVKCRTSIQPLSKPLYPHEGLVKALDPQTWTASQSVLCSNPGSGSSAWSLRVFSYRVPPTFRNAHVKTHRNLDTVHTCECDCLVDHFLVCADVPNKVGGAHYEHVPIISSRPGSKVICKAVKWVTTSPRIHDV